MEIILPGYEIIEQQPGLSGMWRMVEICARVCYKSQDKMSDNIESAEDFVKRVLIHSDNYEKNHGAMLEHAAVYLKIEYSTVINDLKYAHLEDIVHKYKNNKYSKVHIEFIDNYHTVGYITTNLRVVYENGWMDDLKYWCEPTEHHEKRISVLFTVDRFTGEEFIRHRAASFGRESTRYVNFVRERFGHSIKFVLPPWLREHSVNPWDETTFRKACKVIGQNGDEDIFTDIDYWLFALYSAEYSYFKLVEKFKWHAQQARTVLSCAISSPLVKSAYVSDWKHFFNLRYFGITGSPHPQAKELAEPLYLEFVERNIIEKYNPE